MSRAASNSIKIHLLGRDTRYSKRPVFSAYGGSAICRETYCLARLVRPSRHLYWRCTRVRVHSALALAYNLQRQGRFARHHLAGAFCSCVLCLKAWPISTDSYFVAADLGRSNRLVLNPGNKGISTMKGSAGNVLNQASACPSL